MVDDAEIDSMYVFPSKSISNELNSLLATALERRGSGLSKTGFRTEKDALSRILQRFENGRHRWAVRRRWDKEK